MMRGGTSENGALRNAALGRRLRLGWSAEGALLAQTSAARPQRAQDLELADQLLAEIGRRVISRLESGFGM